MKITRPTATIRATSSQRAGVIKLAQLTWATPGAVDRRAGLLIAPVRCQGASWPRVEDADLRGGIRLERHGDEEPAQVRGDEARPGPGRAGDLREQDVAVG